MSRPTPPARGVELPQFERPSFEHYASTWDFSQVAQQLLALSESGGRSRPTLSVNLKAEPQQEREAVDFLSQNSASHPAENALPSSIPHLENQPVSFRVSPRQPNRNHRTIAAPPGYETSDDDDEEEKGSGAFTLPTDDHQSGMGPATPQRADTLHLRSFVTPPTRDSRLSGSPMPDADDDDAQEEAARMMLDLSRGSALLFPRSALPGLVNTAHQRSVAVRDFGEAEDDFETQQMDQMPPSPPSITPAPHTHGEIQQYGTSHRNDRQEKSSSAWRFGAGALQELLAAAEQQVEHFLGERRDQLDRTLVGAEDQLVWEEGDIRRHQRQQSLREQQELSQLEKASSDRAQHRLMEMRREQERRQKEQDWRLQTFVEEERKRLEELRRKAEEERRRQEEEARRKAEEERARQVELAAKRAEEVKRVAEAKEKEAAAAAAQTARAAAATEQKAAADQAENSVQATKEYMERMVMLKTLRQNCANFEQQSADARRLRMSIKGQVNKVAASVESLKERAGFLGALMDQARRASPLHLEFALDQFAQAVVAKGESHVAKNRENAFPFAHLALQMCMSEPKLVPILLANFHEVCVYTVPYFPSNRTKEGLGYRKAEEQKDGFESEDSYLERMQGYMALYAAFTQIERGGHPFGIEHAWVWLARMCNRKPKSATASVLLAFLQTAAYRLQRVYPRQMVKVLRLIERQLVPLMPETTEPRAAARKRVSLFIQEYITKRGQLDMPKGMELAATQTSTLDAHSSGRGGDDDYGGD